MKQLIITDSSGARHIVPNYKVSSSDTERIEELESKTEELSQEVEQLPSEFFDITTITSSNLLNEDDCTLGLLTSAGAIHSGGSYNNYWYSGYIPVSSGDVLSYQWGNKSKTKGRSIGSISRYCFYDSNKSVVSGGSDTSTQSITIPNGVSYVRVCVYGEGVLPVSSDNAAYSIVKGTTVIDWQQYFVGGRTAILKSECNNSTFINGLITSALSTKGYDTDISSLKTSSSQLTSSVATLSENVSSITESKQGVVTIEPSFTKVKGYYYVNGAQSNASYFYVELNVKEGDTIEAKNTIVENVNMRFLDAYKDTTRVPSACSSSSINKYVVPNGVNKVFVTIYIADESYYDHYYFTITRNADIVSPKGFAALDERVTALESGGGSSADSDDFKEHNLFTADNLVEGENFLDNKFSWSGSESSNSAYLTYILEVKPNTLYFFYQGTSYTGARSINEYNGNKTFISGKAYSNKYLIETSANTKYLHVSFYRGSNEKIEIKEVINNGNTIKAFLPDTIYCAVGRTIEVYNSQVCANSFKYNFKWICNIGKNLKRKFSVTGQSVADKKLILVIYDDYKNALFAKECNLKVVANTISANKSVVPVGDSLTNGKNWLAEIETLSSDKIAFVGTYSFSVTDSSGAYKSGSHDGRSGAEPNDYLTKASFTKGGITYTNTWWSGSRFSLNSFKSATSKNPDCVQIWLGTNGITNPQQANYIKQLVDNIRTDNATIPIVVCYTIFRGDQNGIGNQGGVDGYSASGDSYKFNEDCLVIDLKKKVNALLSSYSNVYLVDLGVSHDSEYNFATSEVSVNPRASQKEVVQTESVHPNAQGYFQIADVLFSAYCSIFG